MSDQSGYNGWKNYETWCVNLWLTNDQGTDEMLRELVEEHSDSEDFELADAIKNMVEDFAEVEEVQSKASFVTDLFGAAFSEVDWLEIARNAREDI